MRGRRDDGPGRGGLRGDGPGVGPARYQMREKLASIGDDFWIENALGRKIYKVDGKAVRVRDTLVIRDGAGRAVAEIQERLVNVRDTMEISRDGRRIAVVKKAMFTPLRSRFDVNVEGGADLTVQGNIVDHEYRVDRGNQQVAQISKAWFRVRDTYGVEIQPGEDEGLILAVTVVVDQLAGIG